MTDHGSTFTLFSVYMHRKQEHRSAVFSPSWTEIKLHLRSFLVHMDWALATPHISFCPHGLMFSCVCGYFQAQHLSFLWPLYGIGQAIIFLPCGFFYLLSSFFSLPNLSGRRVDVYHTSTHGVALVRIWDAGLLWNVLHTARWKYRMQKWSKKSPSRHHRTTLSGHIFATKACIDNRKKTC